MQTNKSELSERSLSALIRVFGDKVFSDIVDLVDHILTPVKSELSRAGNQFSADLLKASIIYTLGSYQEDIALESVVQNVIELHTSRFKTGLEMVNAISRQTSISLSNKDMSNFVKKFAASVANLSEGMARKLVHASYIQWRKALGMRELTASEQAAYGIELPAKAGESTLQNIRIGTRFELSDATSLATRILNPVRKLTDKPTFEFAHNFFIAVSLHLLHDCRAQRLDAMLSYIVAPGWDCVEQMFNLGSLCNEGAQPKTKSFAEAFRDDSLALQNSVSSSLVKRSHDLWAKALGMSVANTIASAESCNSVQIFNLKALAAAATCVSDMHPERKGGAERLLKAAQENNGYRTLPDPKKAFAVLEKAKDQFENLRTPISYLQKNLVLSAAMGAQNFRVRPIFVVQHTRIVFSLELHTPLF